MVSYYWAFIENFGPVIQVSKIMRTIIYQSNQNNLDSNNKVW